MMQYTNGFSCALNADSGELIVKFVQQTPVFKENGITNETNINDITEIIMPHNVAKQLAIALNSILDNKSEE